MVDEVEERRLAPVDVVEDQDERLPARNGLDECEDGGEELAAPGRGRSEPDRPGDGPRDEITVRLTLEQPGDPRPPGLRPARRRPARRRP